jgi:hypothetical protein
MGKILRFLSLVAGVRVDALDRAPNAMAQPAMFGLAILITSSIASLTAAYAVSRIFYGNSLAWIAAAVAGVLWGGLVFSIDRTMLSLDKSGPIWKVALQVALRLAMAVAVGLAISQPIFLRVARLPIDLGIHEAARARVADEDDHNALQEGLPAKTLSYSSAEEESKSARVELEAGPSSSPDYSAKVRARDAAQLRYHEVLVRNGTQLLQTKRKLAELPEQMRAASPLSAEIQLLKAAIRDASQGAARANEDVERAESIWRQQANDRLASARQELEVTRHIASDATAKVDRENAISRGQIDSLTRPDLATEYTRSRQIMNDPKNPYAASLLSLSWILHSLFILVESLIVTTKALTSESDMDKTVKTIESEETEKLYLEANARIMRMQMAVEATNDLYAKALAKWHTEKLQLIQMNGTISTRVLREIREECAEVVEAAA